MSLRRAVSSAFKLLPDEGMGLKRLYRAWWAARRRRLLESHARASGWRQPSPSRVLAVPPALVARHTNFRPNGEQRELRNRVFGPAVLPGTVLDGEWDRDCPPFEDLLAYQSIRDRVLRGTPWRETAYFAESMRDIEAGRPLWDSHNAEELEARFHYVDSLVDSIRLHGLRLQHHVGARQDPTRRYSDEVEVNIGRDGDILFQDGRHRMCIAKVLGVPSIPVKIRVRHLLWQQFREHLFDMCEDSEPVEGVRLLPQPAPHPDLGDIAAHPAAERSLVLLVEQLAGRRARVFDIGCRLGFFSDALAAGGHEVLALEGDERWREAAERIRSCGPQRFELLRKGDAERLDNLPFDTVLALGNAPGWHYTEQDLTALRLALAPRTYAAPCVFMMATGTTGGPDLPDPVRAAVARGTLSTPQVLATLPGGRLLVQLAGHKPSDDTRSNP